VADQALVVPYRDLCPVCQTRVPVDEMQARRLLRFEGDQTSVCPACRTPLRRLFGAAWQVDTQFDKA
jgi:hypothetical protein